MRKEEATSKGLSRHALYSFSQLATRKDVASRLKELNGLLSQQVHAHYTLNSVAESVQELMAKKSYDQSKNASEHQAHKILRNAKNLAAKTPRGFE